MSTKRLVRTQKGVRVTPPGRAGGFPHTLTAQAYNGQPLPEATNAGSFTLELWFCVLAWANAPGYTNSEEEQTIILTSGNAGYSFILRVIPDGRLYGSNYAGQSTFTNPGFAVTRRWQHLAYVHDVAGSNAIWYLNGQVDTTAAITSAVPGITGIALGHIDSYRSFKPFVGLMDELRIWSTVRSAAQIAANYNSSNLLLITNGELTTANGGVHAYSFDESAYQPANYVGYPNALNSDVFLHSSYNQEERNVTTNTPPGLLYPPTLNRKFYTQALKSSKGPNYAGDFTDQTAYLLTENMPTVGDLDFRITVRYRRAQDQYANFLMGNADGGRNLESFCIFEQYGAPTAYFQAADFSKAIFRKVCEAADFPVGVWGLVVVARIGPNINAYFNGVLQWTQNMGVFTLDKIVSLLINTRGGGGGGNAGRNYLDFWKLELGSGPNGAWQTWVDFDFNNEEGQSTPVYNYGLVGGRLEPGYLFSKRVNASGYLLANLFTADLAGLTKPTLVDGQNVVGTTSVSNGTLTITPTPNGSFYNFVQVVTDRPYSIANSRFITSIVQAISGPNTSCGLGLADSASTNGAAQFRVFIEGGSLYAADGATMLVAAAAYDPVAMYYWQIRGEAPPGNTAGGTAYIEYSADAVSWTTLISRAFSAFSSCNPLNCRPLLQAGFSPNSTAPGSAVFGPFLLT